MNTTKLKLTLVGFVAACAFGAIAIGVAWATPGLNAFPTVIAGPVVVGELDLKAETDSHELELKAKGLWQSIIVRFHIAPGGHTGWHSHPGPAFVMVILPTRPRMPRHKGKVERIVGYVQDNALKGRTFASLADQNRHLLDWERTVADTRIHGTTQKQVKKCFEEVERAALSPLPANQFPSFQEGRRKVNRDGHVEVDKAYYSVPPEYLGRAVWARWDARVVRIFNGRFEQIAFHVKHAPGRFSTQDRHIDDRKRSGIERGTAHHLNQANLIGPHTTAVQSVVRCDS